MVICKYFQQNRCRYGNNCRFEHDVGGGAQRQLRFDTGGNSNSRYKWTAQNDNNNSGDSHKPEDIVSSLRSNLETWEHSKMWPYSCMALEKDQPCIPEFTDLSADELRWEAYQAIKGGGNLMAYTEKVNQLTEEYRNKRLLLKHPTADIKNQLIQFINSCRQNTNTDSKSSFVKPSAFGGAGSGSSGAFGSAVSSPAAANTGFGGQSSSNNIFGGQSSFGSQPASSAFGGQSSFGAQNTSSSFGQSATFGAPGSFGGQSSGTFGNQSNAGSIFSNAAKSSGFGNNAGSGSVMGKPATFGQTGASGSLFGQGTAQSPATSSGFGQTGSTAFGQTQSGFGQTQQSGSVFGQSQGQGQSPVPASGLGQNPSRNLFGKNQPQSTGSIFGSSGFSASSQGTSAFGISAASSDESGIHGQTTSVNTKSTVYTPLDQLTADERAQFEADQFTPGRIPVKPPPRELVK